VLVSSLMHGNMSDMSSAGIQRKQTMSRSGRIRIQLIALLLLGIAISLFLSSAKSLSREFDGWIIDTHADEGLRSGYWLDLSIADGLARKPDPSAAALQAMQGKLPLKRVGVSGMVYNQARPFQRATKAAWSCFIYIDEDRHIDLGIKWFIWGIIGICAALIIHGKSRERETLPTSSLDEEEDEDAPEA